MKKYLMTNESGVTLIESMIAIMILTIGVLSLYIMQIRAIDGNAKAVRMTYGTNWTTAQIERLVTLPYDDDLLLDSDEDGTGQDGDSDGIDDDGGDFGLDDTVNPDGSMDSPDGMYTIFWNVAVGQRMPNLKSVRVIVRYNGSGLGVGDIVMDYIKPRM